MQGKKNAELQTAKASAKRSHRVAGTHQETTQKATPKGKKRASDTVSHLSEGGSGEGDPLYYVGIGASAGGLEALRPFVANLPTHANMTYIVAQHMSPDHRSLMVELLSRETRLNVQEASNNLPPLADTIYVAPPNADITVANGKLRISKPTNTVGPKPSVDRFFMSLADDREDHAIGIILSGTGSDGARGIKAIKAAGGISIAQEPKSAKYDSMPNAAIRAGGTDLVLPPQEIANQLRSIVQWPRAPIVEDADETPPSTIRGIIQQISTHTGMDFSNYKDATITRQIMRRMAAMQIPSLEAYGEYIGKRRQELNELASNFLICVTSFFRDPESFEALRKELRELLKSKRPGDDIRFWMPGCATGEEVYSLAILLAEELGDQRDKYRIQLFATDINGEAVSMARAGLYPEAALSGIDSALIARYFTVQEGMYLVDKSLRDMTLFARQDLVQDPPFVRLDMVSCRNLLIYFKPELQDSVIKVFHYALRNNAILFLGKSESIGRLGNLFIEKDRKNKIYVKRPVASPVLTGFPRSRNAPASAPLPAAPARVALPTNSALAHDRLFDLYTPASLLMTSSGEILEVFGDCSPFLAIRKGKADFNAFALIKPPFRAELRAFAHRVGRTRQSAVCNPTKLPVEGGTRHFRMAVHYCGDLDIHDSSLLLVCFESADAWPGTADGSDAIPGTSERIVELEHEIVLNRENLQTVIEELETANEELQSLNEEAQAANEELQASNEELETANEELQASNEELITVNDELGTRTQELSDANSDLTNILNSLHKALLVVDRNLTVTRYNKVALDFFDILPGMRPNLASLPMLHGRISDLLTRVGQVMQSGATEEFEFQRDDLRHYQVRLTPYRGESRRAISGVVITIDDITERKAIEEKLQMSASVFEHASEAMLITDPANRIVFVNPAFTTITGYAAEEVLGKNPKLLNSGLHSKEFFKEMWEKLLSAGTWRGEIRNRHKNGNIYTELLSINVLKNLAGDIVRHIAVFSDITDAKIAQETIERQATFDWLTGLPNRNLTMDRLSQLLSANRRSGHMFAVMFLDLDHFKAVNDALGHVAGDELLVKTAQRIRSMLRDADTVGRMGGDEFIVLLSELNSAQDIVPIANKIVTEVRRPLTIAGHTLQTATSIGITVYPMDGDTPDILLKNADSAMYEAKKNGRNTYCFFTHRMQDESNKRLWIDTELLATMQQERIQVYYQPIVRLSDMSIVGAEALAHWHHPARGLIPAEVFVPVAEQNGMIVQLGQTVFETGIADWKALASETRPLSLSFNLSAAQFVAHNHIASLLDMLTDTRIGENHRITIEITESLKLFDSADYLETLNRFRGCGCLIAIDDFGTGHSSLSYLTRIPVDIIKIDKSFVQRITSAPNHAAMIRAILQMAASFELKTVAEGVETREQLEFLKAHGCDYAQGFLLARPMPFDQFQKTLQQTHATTANAKTRKSRRTSKTP